MRKQTFKLAAFFASIALLCSGTIGARNTPSLIPYPSKIKLGEGTFKLSAKTQLVLEEQGKFTNEIFFLQSILSPLFGQYLSSENGDNKLVIKHSDKVSAKEGYTLDITSDEILISASTPTGAFYAIQSIRQLLPANIEYGEKVEDLLELPIMSINDKPAFEWRGTMLDVSRHMFTVEYIKKHIDRLALYKMNKLHLHLTDDQGWRIEIKKYPKLTENGAWRNYNGQDKECIAKAKDNPDFEIDPRFIIKQDGKDDIYGGFFTQDQIKEIVRYATTKHIEVIPEIDMPGHMAAAIANYPELADGSGWGKQFSVPLNPAIDSVYTFVNDVLSEVMELFPSKYIHIGSDEVEKSSWKESKLCQDLMVKEGIESVDKLQSYFLHKVQDFVESKGKQLITWDEALDGGIDSNINIMFWRGWVPKAPMIAAQNSNFVIMSPNNPVYFDYLPDMSSLNNVYHMDVIYDDVPKELHHFIRGAQANLWAETIPSENRSEFMMFPRLLALAERLWTNQDLFGQFSERILDHYPRLDALGVNYRLPDIPQFAMESVFVKEGLFDVKSPLEGMTIHYTTDGSLPELTSPELTEGMKITKPIQIKFALFSQGGVRGEIYTINYTKSDMQKAAKIDKKDLKAGLACDFFEGYFQGTKKIKEVADKHLIATNLSAPKEAKAAQFGLKFQGYIDVPETGIYSFFFTCDDGGMIYINDKVVVDNDGLHSPVLKSGQAALQKGLHPINLDFVEGGGGFTLRVQYSFDNGEIKDIPDSWFVH